MLINETMWNTVLGMNYTDNIVALFLLIIIWSLGDYNSTNLSRVNNLLIEILIM